MSSTSGGAFTAISDYFLGRGGVVYGAAFDSNFKVSHLRCTNPKDCDRLKGSKYVQSDLADIFPLVKEDLERDTEVMFSGTPCQVAGLKGYLGTEHKGLFCCDLVCHGVPSPSLFRKYLLYLKEKDTAEVIGVEFRNKSRGWRNFSFAVQTQKGKTVVPFNDDPYCYLFSINIMLRPACYSCKFSNMSRVSDITMGDFWGGEISLHEFMDDKGVSLVLVNTAKGRAVFDSIRGVVDVKESSSMDCLQPNLIKPTPKSPHTDKFWEDYAVKGFNYVISRYTLKNPLVRIDQALRLWVGRAWFFPYLKRAKSILAGGWS